VASNTYKVTSTSKSGTTFSIERTAAGAIVRTCSVAKKGGCLTGGTW
jgi:hypothetical protein